ncbi:hypothetical protein ABKN59_010492 [Abortiporus biennis]
MPTLTFSIELKVSADLRQFITQGVMSKCSQLAKMPLGHIQHPATLIRQHIPPMFRKWKTTQSTLQILEPPSLTSSQVYVWKNVGAYWTGKTVLCRTLWRTLSIYYLTGLVGVKDRA